MSTEKQIPIEQLEARALEMMKNNSKRASGLNNKVVLVELLSKGKHDRAFAPVKAATLYFTKSNVEPTEADYKSKIKSIKNSLDTLISQYNSDVKVANDKLIAGTKLVNENGIISITK